MPHRYWNANIGDPAGDYFQVGTVFERDFTNGKVVVNATSTGVSVDLGGSYTTLGGKTVSTLWMPPHSGEALTASDHRSVRTAGAHYPRWLACLGSRSRPAGSWRISSCSSSP